MATGLLDVLNALPGRRVLVLGDFMLDRYVHGRVERVSPEAPVPIMHFHHQDDRLGGAANVAADLAALDVEVAVVGTFNSQDEAGTSMASMLQAIGVDTGGMVHTPGRCTTSKQRMVGMIENRKGQLLRVDYEDPGPVDDAVAEQLLAEVESRLGSVDVLCIEDYNKGACSDRVCRDAIALAKKAGVPVLVDPARIREYGKYAGATLLKMNRTETRLATGLPVESDPDVESAATKLLSDLDLEAVVVTVDQDGAYLATKDGPNQRVASKARQVFDAVGAGDMMIAMICAARAAGADWVQSVALGNAAAGLEVEKFGVVPISRQEIIAELLSEIHGAGGKRRDLPALTAELDQHRAAGRRIVFTNGCFDLIHLGHVQYFQFARRQGDLLVVGVNTDESIQRLKGDKRPIVSLDDRLGVLEELESIDYLVTFDSDTPIDLIKAVRPSVLVKGADYQKEQVVGWDLVEADGGIVALAPLVDGRSTSNVIDRIINAYS